MSITFPSQSPAYYANNRDRYERRKLIENIESETGRKILVYISNFNHPNSGITRNDIVPFSEMCHDINEKQDVDLVIHSPGGDPNSTEQMVNMLLARCNSLRVIIPQSAKSAATMMSLAADEIIMSDSSELGPIDPQIPIMTQTGPIFRPAKGLLNGLEKIVADVHESDNQLNSAYYPILQGIDAALIDTCEKSILHSKNLASKWMMRSMCDNEPDAMKIAEQLIDIEKYPNHGAVISYKDASSLGLKVRYLPQDDNLWEAFWRLFCMYDMDSRNNEIVKFFETGKISFRM